MLGAGQAVLSYLIVESVGADAQHLCAFTVLACHILGLLLPRTVSTCLVTLSLLLSSPTP